MTTYEQIEKRGFEKGIEKGIVSEKTRLIIQGYKRRFSLEIISDISGFSHKGVKKILHESEK